ncbi:NmrA family NAD(P)-binding protein [soil metagenome]
MRKIKILILGATGNVGFETLRILVKKYFHQVEIFAGVLNVEEAKKKILFPGINFIQFDFENYSTFDAALTGIDKLFLVRPPQLSDVKKIFTPLIIAVKKQNISHIVFLSLQGVEKNPITPHYKIEKLIQEKNIPFSFLRPSFFMQNLTTTHRQEIKEKNEIFIPAGNGKTNFVDVRDIAEVAARILISEDHVNKAYELTGPEALDYFEIANIISKEVNREIIYKNPSILSFIISKKREGYPFKFITVMIALYTVARLGKAAGYSPELENLLGRVPGKFTEFAHDHKDVWK